MLIMSKGLEIASVLTWIEVPSPCAAEEGAVFPVGLLFLLFIVLGLFEAPFCTWVHCYSLEVSVSSTIFFLKYLEKCPYPWKN